MENGEKRMICKHANDVFQMLMLVYIIKLCAITHYRTAVMPGLPRHLIVAS